MKSFKFYAGLNGAVLFACFAFFVTGTPGQGVCPVKRLSVSEVRGNVLSAGRENPPIPNTKVELFSFGREESLVATTSTDNDGMFSFGKVPTGKYRLVVYFEVDGKEVAPKYDSLLLKVKPNQRRTKKLLRIELSTNCHETQVTLVSA
ncbi:MAG: carboxypeptidase-like regulatory domain-containing protein [Pyrinomonadaceae bacterium]